MATARPLWSGAISFGLVSIPVRLFTAVREERVSFHMLHDQDHVRLRRKLVCPAEDREVHPEHIVKGYEVEKDRYVVIRPDEIEACGPKSSKAIEITDFVDLRDIDPIYYDRPYYVLPQQTAVKPFRLLLEAMTQTKKIGVAKLVMHDKEYLAALRPFGGIICLHTMHFGKEVVPAEGLLPGEPPKIGEREMNVAQQLVESLAGKFQPNRYHDEYKECLLKLIERKAHGEEIVSAPQPERQPAHVGNLMAALEASLAEAKSRGAESNGNGRHGRTARTPAPAKAHPRRRKSA
jgi:DNA end-binding protein Ku